MEIEKKFLVKELPVNLKEFEKKIIEQAYLSTGPVVRIRRSNDRYILTYKSKDNIDINEFPELCISNEIEMPLTKVAYEHLREKADGMLIRKDRYVIPLNIYDEKYGMLKAELDVFDGELKGLVFVEVEFCNENQALEFEPPSWFGEDVSWDQRYKNSFLSTISSREEYKQLFS